MKRMRYGFTVVAALLAAAASLCAQEVKRGAVKFDGAGLFQDDFRTGSLERWGLSEDGRYHLNEPTPERLAIVQAPGLPEGAKAVRFVVPRAVGSFRSEISLRSEKGYQERWYSQRLLVPEGWVPEFSSRGNDIVMQWHGIPGNWKPTFPNLEISIGRDKWFVRQSFGSARTPTRTNKELPIQVEIGKWSSWVVHAKWSPKDDGLIQIWKDGMMIFESKGPNVYGDIGAEYTPYIKTGIYHPEWNTNTDEKRKKFEEEKPQSLLKTIYVTAFRMGDGRQSFEEMNPKEPAGGK